MVQKLKNILKSPNRFYVVGISIVGDVSEYQFIQILFHENELKIEDRYFSNDFNEVFKQKLTKDYPLILHIEGDNIINKCVENKTGYRKDLLFKANQDEFYFFEYFQKEEVYISVARKENIDGFIEPIKQLGLFVVNLSIGPFVMASLLNIVKDYNSISTSNYTIEIANQEILTFKKEQSLQKEYIINEESFNQRELPLLANVINFKFSNPAIEFDTEFLSKNKEEFKFKKWFKVAGIFSLIFFLISLPLSHFLMNYYTEALTEKEFLNAVTQENIVKLSDLKNEKLLKEKILQSSGISNKSFLTKYISDIGNTVSSNMVLNKVEIIPTLKKTKPTEKINVDINGIIVNGVSNNDKSFNDWLKKMKALPWIKKLDIVEYTQETKTENTFTIKITI